MSQMYRREFLQRATALAAVAGVGLDCSAAPAPALAKKGERMKFGLVTYLWGQDMDLPTLIAACQKSGLQGVELRTEHAHRVEPNLSESQRRDVRRRFEDSSVVLVGYGANAQFHDNDPAKVQKNIDLTKQYIELMHDCGGLGVKVKPNGFVKDVPREKTIEQIAKALNKVAAFAADFGQKIRLEVHGQGTSELPVIKAICDIADHPNLGICWNCNDVDLAGEGLEYNFNLVKKRFGDTVHVRELDRGDYPYDKLMQLYVNMDYEGWILLEARTNPADKVAAMTEQRKAFERLVGRKA